MRRPGDFQLAIAELPFADDQCAFVDVEEARRAHLTHDERPKRHRQPLARKQRAAAKDLPRAPAVQSFGIDDIAAVLAADQAPLMAGEGVDAVLARTQRVVLFQDQAAVAALDMPAWHGCGMPLLDEQSAVRQARVAKRDAARVGADDALGPSLLQRPEPGAQPGVRQALWFRCPLREQAIELGARQVVT